MKQELQDKLYEKYPKLFGQKDQSMYQTCMCWGIETRDGWYNIIDNACNIIQWYVDESRKERARNLQWNRILSQALNGNTANLYRFYNKRLGYNEEQTNKAVQEQVERKVFREVKEALPQLQFTQVKEKYGTLRIYTNYTDDYISGVIVMAENMSGSTCEVCGVPGRLTGKGWYSTLCKRCEKEHDNPNERKAEDNDE